MAYKAVSVSDLLRYEHGVFYFRIDNRDIAVSAIEAKYSIAADHALADDATLEDLARYLATEKKKALAWADKR